MAAWLDAAASAKVENAKSAALGTAVSDAAANAKEAVKRENAAAAKASVTTTPKKQARSRRGRSHQRHYRRTSCSEKMSCLRVLFDVVECKRGGRE